MFSTSGSQCRNYSTADGLLLAAQMFLEKLVPGDVPGVHARDGVIHQKLGIELGNAGRCRDRSEGLAKIVAPLRKRISIFLCFRDVSRLAVSREHPLSRLGWIHFPAETNCADQAQNHLSR